MKDARREYEAALADFSRPGARWQTKGRLTYWGKAAGLSAEDIVSDARAHGVTDRDADIRRGWTDAKPKGDRPPSEWRGRPTRTKPKPPSSATRIVRDLVAAGGGEASSADLLALSPLAVPTDAATQTADFLRALFAPADRLHIFRDDAPTAGRPGENLMPCADWLARIEGGGTAGGDLIVPNPFTGAAGDTASGRKSYIAQSCLARFPFAVVEFDSMPLKVQAAFWRGLLSKSPLAPNVASIVFSGGKSLHGLLYVGRRTLADWQTVRGRLRGILAADPDAAFRADEQAMRPRTGTRLPGVRRFDNGKMQRLLYLNPEAVRTRAEKPAAPTAAPSVTPADRPTVSSCAFSPPPPPPDGAPLDDILDYQDMLDSLSW